MNTKMYKHLASYYWIYLGLVIYLLFFISVTWTGWFDTFFSAAALHIGAKGIDFYQVPRGAWAFWHGGSLTGDPLSDGSQYAKELFANSNVYHPVFTILIGSLLMQFNPLAAPYAWLWIKLIVSLLLIFYFIRSFRTHPYMPFGVFILCANFSAYLELAAWQFHFVLNVLILLFLIELVKRRSPIWSGLLYWGSMVVKPVGLLFVPALLFKGRWKIVAIGVGFFVVNTLLTLVGPAAGAYYTNNLSVTLTSPPVGPNQIITLQALLIYSLHWPSLICGAIQNIALVAVIFLGSLRRIHISKAIFLAVVYYLLFYSMVFEYQWSTLAYVLPVCVVCCREFQTRLTRSCIILTCLPSCFVFLALWHIDVKDEGYYGLIPGATAWQFMTISKIIPLALLLACVLVPDIKPIYQQVKAFWIVLRDANTQLQVFGDEGKQTGYNAADGKEHEPPFLAESSAIDLVHSHNQQTFYQRSNAQEDGEVTSIE
jgi:hypothetical protein